MSHALLPFLPLLTCMLLLPCGCGHDGGSGNTLVTLDPPANVQASALAASVSLEWSAVTNAGSYCVYYAASPDLTPANWNTLQEGHQIVPATSPLLVAGLTNGTTYTFVVTAWSTDGTRESQPSAAVQATPIAGALPGYTAPVTQAALAVGSTGATLAGRFDNPPGYTTSGWFEYGTTTTYGTSTTPQFFAVQGPIDVTVQLTNLPPATLHHYRLVTANAGGQFAGADQTFVTLAEPGVLLGNLNAPVGLCYDGTYVFFFEVYGGRLRRVHATTGAATTLATRGTAGNSGAATVFGSTVFFADYNGVYRIESDGSGAANWAWLTEAGELLGHTTGLYVRHGQVISWIHPTGTPVVDFYVRTPIGSEGFGGGLAADATHLYWTDYFSGTVEKLAFAGGPKVTLALLQNHPSDLLAEGDMLYFATEDGLRRVAKTGGLVVPIASAAGPFTKQGNLLYVANATQVFTVDATTGAVTVLATGANSGSRPVVTNDHILWLRRGSQYELQYGALLRIPKP